MTPKMIVPTWLANALVDAEPGDLIDCPAGAMAELCIHVFAPPAPMAWYLDQLGDA